MLKKEAKIPYKLYKVQSLSYEVNSMVWVFFSNKKKEENILHMIYESYD